MCLLYEGVVDKFWVGGGRWRRKEKDYCFRKGVFGLARDGVVSSFRVVAILLDFRICCFFIFLEDAFLKCDLRVIRRKCN